MSYVLAAAQTVLVAVLVTVSWSRDLTWARAGVIAAGTWVLIFLIPSWIFVADPSLLTVGSRNGAIATVDLSLVCLIVGYGGARYAASRSRGRRVMNSQSDPGRASASGRQTRLDRRWLIAWLVLGVLGFAVLFSTTGGPIHFVENLADEGAMTRGKTYFIFAGMALVWVPQALICAHWLNGSAAGWRLLVAFAIALALTATLGARELLAVPLIELALFYWAVRRRISARRAATGIAVAVFLIVFVVGMVKRYGNYVAEHPGTKVSRLEFMFSKGPTDFAHSYAINTADGVALIALGEHVVPSQASPELGKELLRLALQVIPSSARPTLHTAPAIKAAIYPSNTDVYAQPLQLVSYLQFELPGLIVAFLGLGAVAAEIDRLLLARARYRLSTLLLLVALATAVSMLLRNAAAPATADTIVEVVGIWAVAYTSERSWPAASGQLRR
jgi:hypothetical protein